jgi:2',3'-cyclic-nucleotide 2'-phosphodiesterase (5'-nucleotidase family)
MMMIQPQRSAFALLLLSSCLVTSEGFATQQRTPFLHGRNLRKSTSHRAKRTGGGRAPGQDDQVLSSDEWEPTPCGPEEARLTIIQITDTYTLENLASVKTLVADIKAKAEGSTVISAMTGDFLSPYLLSSVDRGQGMMNALARIPIDYITWGNHEVSPDERKPALEESFD